MATVLTDVDPATQSDAAMDSLGAAERIAESVDPAGLWRAYQSAMVHAAARPLSSGPALARYCARMATVGTATAAQLMGAKVSTLVQPDAKDQRFADPVWQRRPLFHAIEQAYLLTSRLLLELVDTAELDEVTSAKAQFTARLLGDSLAPTNFLVTNPTALRHAVQTGGASVVHGAQNFLHDLRENHGWPSQVDRAPGKVGQNLAATPGRVVYRNELMELIQYESQTDEVFEIPLLVCPPWINRYYILDLAPGKSLVEWAVRHGHTTFAISYRNPGPTTGNWSLDDYLRLGPLTALDVVREITGSETVNTLAACLGGTLNAACLAYLDAKGANVVNSSTSLVSAIDYTDGGVLRSVFTDRRGVETLAQKVETQGFIEATQMAHTFNLLRANDLVFRYLVEGWLLGKKPAYFDLLAWNDDSTRIPGRAHSQFLRAILDNELAEDRFQALGERLLISDITTESYVLAAIDDHIVPWKSAYRSTQLFKGPVRFVLTSSGHIAGMVNPPSPKTRMWTADDLPPDPARWLEDAVEARRSWWEDWAEWLGARAGATTAPPPMGSTEHPAKEPAPGTYVHT